jgi:hypothetical protein
VLPGTPRSGSRHQGMDVCAHLGVACDGWQSAGAPAACGGDTGCGKACPCAAGWGSAHWVSANISAGDAGRHPFVPEIRSSSAATRPGATPPAVSANTMVPSRTSNERDHCRSVTHTCPRPGRARRPDAVRTFRGTLGRPQGDVNRSHSARTVRARTSRHVGAGSGAGRPVPRTAHGRGRPPGDRQFHACRECFARRSRAGRTGRTRPRGPRATDAPGSRRTPAPRPPSAPQGGRPRRSPVRGTGGGADGTPKLSRRGPLTFRGRRVHTCHRFACSPRRDPQSLTPWRPDPRDWSPHSIQAGAPSFPHPAGAPRNEVDMASENCRAPNAPRRTGRCPLGDRHLPVFVC